jgi:argininosuccinate lyase
VERRLTELEPELGGRLHAGRSRNDQVALDLRLYARAAASALAGLLGEVVDALAAKAAAYASDPMPGYTHLQRAQPVTAGHVLLAHAEPLLRDGIRVKAAHDAAGEMPLGSAALAGSTLPIDRTAVAGALGFRRLTLNSIDAVADRDFLLDLLHACVAIAIHLSRLGEEMVLWASAEFGFLRLADEIATGSSIMPQKRNPDIAELLRGRSGRGLSAYVGLATVLKGLPLAYDRDLQEDKVHTFAAVASCIDSLQAARLLANYLEFDRERLRKAADDPDLLATDSAEKAVAEGRPFREAHAEIGLRVLEGRHEPPWDVANSLQRRDAIGSPQPARVAAAARAARRKAASLRRWAEGS